MNRLVIKQNTVTENVTSDIITKLYTEAKTIKDYEELNNIVDSLVELEGNLLAIHAYSGEVTYLLTKFPDLYINITGDTYLDFEDPYARQFWANTPSGDGTGITLQNAQNLTDIHVNSNYFGHHAGASGSDLPVLKETLEKIKKMNELKYFGLKYSGFYNPLFYYMTSLEEVTLPPGFVEMKYCKFPNIKKIDFSLCGDTLTTLEYPDTANELETVIFPPLINGTNHGGLTSAPKVKDVFFYTLTPAQSGSTWTITSDALLNIWVQDSAYEAWKTNPWVASKNRVTKLRKFSEYTGDDLIQAWVETPNSNPAV